ncbi:MAG: polysaccharide biosynthesis/export family protein [Chitinophagaceae bacterium]
MVLRRTLSLFFAFLFFALAALAQLPGGINIEQLSDQQLMQFVQSNNLSGLSEADLEAKAREKGLSADQIQKLKARVAGLNAGTPNAVKPTSPATEARKPIPYLLPKNSPDSINGLLLFGSEIFTKDNLTFEPNLNIPTPTNYVLGAGDQINVDVFGYSDKTQKYTISADGTIRIPMIGPVKLGGLPIADARNKLISALSRVYPGLRGGNTSLQLTLAQLRSIQVNLIGEITKPGTYTLPSVSTIANALYAAGGPTSIGSYRNIELVRGGKVIARFDLYRYLFNGDLTENKLLQDDDVVRVSAYQTRVEVRGAVQRKAVYEVGANDKLSAICRGASR